MPLALFAVPVIATLAVGPSRVLAYYQGVVHVGVDPLALLERTGMNLLVLLYASGFVLVPGAILGLALVLARPRTRGELAFGAMALFLAVSLLVEAGLFGAFEQAQERYLFYFLPLVFLSFGLYAARGWPFRLYHALLAAGVVTVAAAVPLAGYAASDEKAHSAALYGVFRIEEWLGTPGNGSIAVALAGHGRARSARRLLGPRCAWRARPGSHSPFCSRAGSPPPASSSTRRTPAPCDSPSCPPIPRGSITRTSVTSTLLRNIAGVRGGAFQQLFWNRSVKELLLMPGASEIDPFRADRIQVADDGSLMVGKRVLRDALLVDDHAVTTQFSGRRQGRLGAGILALPPRRATAALALLPRPVRRRLDGGQGNDRPLAQARQRPPRGHARPRPRIAGSARSNDRSVPACPAAASCMSGFRLTARRPSACPSARSGPWATGFQSKMRGFLNDRPLSVKAGVPRFVPGRSGCTAEPEQTPGAAGSLTARRRERTSARARRGRAGGGPRA